VIRASEGVARDGIHGKHWRDLESIPGYSQLRMVSEIVEDALRRVTIADLKENKPPAPATVATRSTAEASSA